MTAPTEDVQASWGFTPWRPRSLSPAADDRDLISTRSRVLLLLAIALAHLGIAGWWYLAGEAPTGTPQETVLVLDFTQAPPELPPLSPAPDARTDINEPGPAPPR